MTAPPGSKPSIHELIEASSFGTPDAVEMRRCGGIPFNVRLTGMPEEQADWDSDEEDQ